MPTTEVPGNYPVALDGRPYHLDNAGDPPLHRHQSVPLLRGQQDTSENVGEQSVNPAGFWRRSIETWHRGAGQEYYDRADSDPARFQSSKGVDVWTENQLTLLTTVSQVTTFSLNELEDAQNQPRIARVSFTSGTLSFANTYLWDGEDVRSENGGWAALSGSPGTDWCGGMVSDGEFTYVHLGEEGLFSIEGDDDVMALCVSASGFDEGFVGLANGRLFVSIGNVLYNVTSVDTGSPPSLPSALLTHPSSRWEWRGCASGPTHSYIGGYGGGISRIYKTTIKADGTALDVPSVAAELPTGEILTTIFGYLNQFVLIGTAEGVRLATIDGDGNLTIGALVPLGHVYSMSAYGRFVWVAGESPDGVHSGLWRLDLSQINGSAPAYAADLYVSGEAPGFCYDVIATSTTPFFVTGAAVYLGTATPLASGTLDQGWTTYNIAENKIIYAIDVRHEALASGSAVAVSTAIEGSTVFTSAGSSSAVASTGAVLSPTNVSCCRVNLRTTLTTTAGSASPNLDVVTSSSIPTADAGYQIIAPFLIGGSDPAGEVEHIKGLRAARTVVEYQEGTGVYDVIVEDFQWVPMDPIADGSAWSGTCITTMKALSSSVLSAPVFYGGGYE